MSALNSADVNKIAQLARLVLDPIDPKGTQEYAKQLSGILAFVEQMSAVQTEGIEPMAHSQDISQRLRPDQVTEVDQRAQFQKIAPSTEAGLYLVPKVIE